MTDASSAGSETPFAERHIPSGIRRRMVRFGLLLTFLLLLCAGCLWLKSDDLGSAVESAGGRYFCINPYPLLQRAFVLVATGNSGRHDRIQFLPGQVNDAWLRRHGEKLRGLRSLNLIMIRTQVTDAGLRELQNATGIHLLDLRGTRLTNRSVAVFSSIGGLYSLNVAHTGISDTALQPIFAGPVPSLGIDAGQLTDTAVNALVTRAGPLQNLKVYRADKESLERLIALRIGIKLTLQGEGINRDCMPLLIELIKSRGIRYLSLFDTDLSDEDRSELAKAIPQCEIYSDSLEKWERLLQRSQPVSSGTLW